MGYSAYDKHGNRINVDDDGGVDITPNGESTMMYKLKDIIDATEKQRMKENADGCKGCAFETVNEWEMPCAKCKRNSKDYWRAKGE